MVIKFSLKLREIVLGISVLLFAAFILGNIYGAVGPDDSDDCSYRANCYCPGFGPVYTCDPNTDPCDLCPEEPETPEPEWPSPPPDGPDCYDEYRCHNNNVELYNTCYGWTGIIIDYCNGDNYTGACGNWKCDAITRSNTYKRKFRAITNGYCSNGSCRTSSSMQQCEQFQCHYGCAEPNGIGDCYPDAVIVSDPAPSGGQIEIKEGESVTFDCRNSVDPEGTVLSCNWDFGAGEGTASGTTVTHTYNNEGSYTVTLTVIDEAGLKDNASVIVNVVHANEPPQACFTVTPSDGNVGITEFTFDAGCSNDPDGYIANYEWDFEDDGSFDVSGAAEVVVTHTYTNKPLVGTVPFTVKLRVTDDGYDGQAPLSAEATETVNVVNNPPNVNIIAQPLSGIAPLTVSFTANVSDPDGHNITSYSWDFGDGSNGSGASVEHTFNSKGNFTVTLTATDEYGASASDNVTITATQPKAITALSASDVLIGNPTTIFVDCSDASDSVDLEIFKQNESGGFDAVTGGSFTINCGSIANYTPAEVGIYKVVATISGCSTAACTRATQFQAKQELPELETPEVNPLLALGIVLAILALIRVKK